MDFIDVTKFSDEELLALLNSASKEKVRRDDELRAKAEKAFYEAACTLYNLEPNYLFPIYESDLERTGPLSLKFLLQIIREM